MRNGRFSLWRASSKGNNSEPFPSRQLFILALCRLGEPIAFTSIFPYIYYMILSFHISDDERQVAMYAGMVTSAFAFAEFCAGAFWGSLSDKVGRKPILLTGLAGTGISMLAFGFSKSLPMAIIARALGGILNGNIGVLNTTVAEVITVEAHKSRGFSIMPFVWGLGSIIGAGLGGTLADPVKNYPGVFRPGGLFEAYPFLLPNIVCAAVVVAGLIVGVLFLEETHEDKKDRRDRGLELGELILRKLKKSKSTPDDAPNEKESLIHDEKPRDYSSAEFSPRPSTSLSIISEGSTVCESIVSAPVSVESDATVCEPAYPTTTEKLSWHQGFTRQVVLTVVGYGIAAFHTISLEQLLPVLFSMPESSTPPSLPFKFTGGFALTTKTVGLVLSAQGILQMIAQLGLFPFISVRLGALRTFRYVIFSYPIFYIIIPYITLLPKELRFPSIFFILIWKVIAQTLCFPSIQIMLAGYAPSKRVLGTINGVAASSASLARALGPTFAGLVQSMGLNIGVSGLAWWFCAMVAVVGIIVSSCMADETPNYVTNAASSLKAEEEDEQFIQQLLRDSAEDA